MAQAWQRASSGETSLYELFRGVGIQTASPPPITLGTLALSVNVQVGRLVPLVEEGWLRTTHDLNGTPVTSQTFVDAPPQPALLWLQQWFQPARAKLLFSRGDVAELTGLTEKAVTKLAAVCRIPVSYEPALGGLVFSAWAVKRLLMAEASGGVAATETDGTRFDRQSLLWMLLERDPKRALTPPSFDEALEQELSRVAALSEPARTLRMTSLWEQWQDARLLAESVVGEAADQGRLTKADLRFSRLRPRGQSR